MDNLEMMYSVKEICMHAVLITHPEPLLRIRNKHGPEQVPHGEGGWNIGMVAPRSLQSCGLCTTRHEQQNPHAKNTTKKRRRREYSRCYLRPH